MGAGAALGVVAFGELADVAERRLPLLPGPAAATVADRSPYTGAGRLTVSWTVPTDQRLVALTFDDGPRPQWTTKVLDTLERFEVPATFFMVGRRVRKYAEVIRGRLDRHEVGNHTWDHLDLARRAQHEAHDDLTRAHEAIVEVAGRVPVLFRPPYGHLGGSAVLAADHLGYQVILWSLQMVESQFLGDPDGHARHIAAQVWPGAILLAHDVGEPDRLVAINGLPRLIEELHAGGYAFVTVSELLHRASIISI